MNIKQIKEKLLSTLSGGDILFIVPPISRSCKGTMLDPHTLQAMAQAQGYTSEVLYLNLVLASLIGPGISELISNAPRYAMLGERLFCRSAYKSMPPLGLSAEYCLNEHFSITGKIKDVASNEQTVFSSDYFLQLEALCFNMILEITPILIQLGYKTFFSFIGWEQTNCTIALFNKLKQHNPNVITLIGGMNCEGAVAEGIASLSSSIDHVFSGEMENGFTNLLKAQKNNQKTLPNIIKGGPVRDLDQLPLPNFENFFQQAKVFIKYDRSRETVISYETSRGCWKGQTQRCTFCGLNNDEQINFRYKSSEKAQNDFQKLTKQYPDKTIFMTDYIIPYTYYKKLFPKLNLSSNNNIRYELLPTASLEELISLKKSKIQTIQPGIEALSTSLLKQMNKGVSAKHNLLLLRNAMSVGISTYWYLLWGLPGDHKCSYEETLELLPLIQHLQPPELFTHIRLERNSSYIESPDKFGIYRIKPWHAYQLVFPQSAHIKKLAFRYTAEYPSESHESPELIRAIAIAVEKWKKTWIKTQLKMVKIEDYYCIFDNREISQKKPKHLLDKDQASTIMIPSSKIDNPDRQWAVQEKLAVVVDNYYVPLITTSPTLLSALAK